MQAQWKQTNLTLKPLAVALAFAVAAISQAAFAANEEKEQQLDEMTVKGDKNKKPAVPANAPSTTEGVTAKQIAESINAVTSVETLNYLPSTHVRERYFGDRNGILVMRVNSEGHGGVILRRFFASARTRSKHFAKIPSWVFSRS